MIIGLTGLKGTGKDTVAAYLIKNHGYERRAFADPLKRSLAAFLGIEFHEIEQYKNDPNLHIDVVRFNGGSDLSIVHSQSFRSALQRYGTEAHRDVFGDNFWVDATLPVGGFYGGRAIVVTDVRFENEAERIRQLWGTLVRIERPSVTPSEKDLHRSEVEQLAIEVNHTIVNEGTIPELYHEVEIMLEAITAL